VGISWLEPTRSLDIGNQYELIEGVILRMQRTKTQRLYYDLAEMPSSTRFTTPG